MVSDSIPKSIQIPTNNPQASPLETAPVKPLQCDRTPNRNTMRSSIACVRCRRSKVKCVNTGPNTTCRACEASNRECTYPPPVASGAPRVSSGATTVRTGGGGGGGGGSGGRDIAPGSVGGGTSVHHGGASGDRSEVCCSTWTAEIAIRGSVGVGEN